MRIPLTSSTRRQWQAHCRGPRLCGGDSGFTLIELLIALSILAAVAASMSVLLVGTLTSQHLSAQQDDLLQMARLAMERMTLYTMRANRLLLPLANKPTRNVLALGGFIDNDGDGLFDEDAPSDMSLDAKAGIIGIDDDGSVDEGLASDDDEDGSVNEDPINGLDDDSDGDIDEDPGNMLDRDGDGLTDEDPVEPVVYYYDAATKTLRERFPTSASTTVTTVLAEQVDLFQVQRLIGTNGAVLIDILLRLKDAQGHEVALRTRVAPRLLRK